MRVSCPLEFSTDDYRHTLFAQLGLVDHRNPTFIAADPVPPIDRVMAFRTAPKFSSWSVHKLDGSPDYRYNPSFIGGGDQWIEFQRLMDRLGQAESKGDIFVNADGSSVPVMLTNWQRGDEDVPAALFTAIEGWSLPLYFKGGFDSFVIALKLLRDLNSQIAAGTAEWVDVIL